MFEVWTIKTSRADGQTVLACIYRVTIMQQHYPYRVFICASNFFGGKNMSLHFFFRPGEVHIQNFVKDLSWDMDPVLLCLVIISPPKVFKWPCRKAQNVTNCHVQNFIIKRKKFKFNEFSLNRIVAFCRKVRCQWNTLVNTREKTSALFFWYGNKICIQCGISAMMSMINS